MSLDPFLERVKEHLPHLNILDSVEASKRYGANTHGMSRVIAGAISPQATQDVQTIVRLANESASPLYPISSGQNWGYGTALPMREGCYILDLSQMKKIIAFDAHLGVVTIEPGVTQGELAQFLAQKNSDYMVPVTGAGPTCSLVGNALEHGFGPNPITDHFAGVMSLQAVLPNGQLYVGAHAGKGCVEIDQLYKWGIGPYLDGLFGQFGLGIVTQMTLALVRRTENPVMIYCKLKAAEITDEAIHAIHQVLENYGGMIGSVKILNNYNVLAMSAPYPHETIPKGQSMVPAGVIEKMCAKYNIAAWSMLITLYAPPSCQRAIIRDIKKILRHQVRAISVLSKSQIKCLDMIIKYVPGIPFKIKGLFKKLEGAFQLMQGYPNDVALPLAYWLKGAPPLGQALNPGRDECGILWYAPVMPMKGEIVRRFARISKTILEAHGFEPLFSVTSMNDKCFDCTVPILFDATDQAAAARARACYLQLLMVGQQQGLYPYRVGVHIMDLVVNENEPFWRLARQIKQAIDPQNIIAPGRYS